jgi:hypothetical protein
MFGGKKLELDRSIRLFVLHALPRGPDHAFRTVTGDNGNVMPGKEEGVFAGTAIEFEDVSTGRKGIEKLMPYRCSLGAANHGASEQVVIVCSDGVKGQKRLILNF